MLKTCTKCGAEKTLECFTKSKSGAGGINPRCKECTSAINRASYATNAERRKKRLMEFRKSNPGIVKKWNKTSNTRRANKQSINNLFRLYGVTEEQYGKMLMYQNGKCAICKSESSNQTNMKRLVLDHCHNTGKPRGLLCNKCNTGLGMFGDRIETVVRAAKYLRSFISS